MTDSTPAEVIVLADGRSVPAVAVIALDELEHIWPGATFSQARPAIVAAVLAALEEAGYAVVERAAFDAILVGLSELSEINRSTFNSAHPTNCGPVQRWIEDVRLKVTCLKAIYVEEPQQ